MCLFFNQQVAVIDAKLSANHPSSNGEKIIEYMKKLSNHETLGLLRSVQRKGQKEIQKILKKIIIIPKPAQVDGQCRFAFFFFLLQIRRVCQTTLVLVLARVAPFAHLAPDRLAVFDRLELRHQRFVVQFVLLYGWVGY